MHQRALKHPTSRSEGEIPGDYQEVALRSGYPYQRAWHEGRIHILKRAVRLARGDALADLGCGSGILLNEVYEPGCRFHAIDQSASAVEYCKSRFSERGNVSVREGTLARTGIPSRSLDWIVCTEVLEHVPASRTAEVFDHWRDLLKDGGRLFLTTPNSNSIWPLMEKGLDLLRLAPEMSGVQHVSKWTQERFRRELSLAGFKGIQTGTFNLLGPWISLFIGVKSGMRAAEVEFDHLGSGGPLIWVTAQL